MILNNGRRYPFVGASVVFSDPIPVPLFYPKAWHTDGSSDMASGVLVSLGSNFISSGVVAGDPVYLIAGSPPLQIATTVAATGSPNDLLLNWMADQNYTNIIFKIGQVAQHTFNSLVYIIAQRKISAQTIHFKQCWTSAIIEDFNRDETGEVYAT